MVQTLPPPHPAISEHLASLAMLDPVLVSLQPERLGPVIAKLGHVFSDLSPKLSDEPIGLFDHLFLSLTPRADIPARATLSNILAPIPNAPPKTSATLANDDAAIVASPMLRLSRRIDFALMMEIAMRRGQDHLLALAQRDQLDEAISSLIAERGQGIVLKALVDNHTAQLSDAAFALMATRAIAQKELQIALKARPDLPERDRQRMDALTTQLTEWTERSAAHDTELLAAINQSDWLQIAEILGKYTKVSASAVLATLATQQIDPILACARAASMDWDTTEMLLIRRLGAQATAKRLHDAKISYKNLTRDSAARALRFLAIKARMGQPTRSLAS
ncbi:MAG: DUF2336 domain-containing protein [Beijerinckiaceae bacterium]